MRSSSLGNFFNPCTNANKMLNVFIGSVVKFTVQQKFTDRHPSPTIANAFVSKVNMESRNLVCLCQINQSIKCKNESTRKTIIILKLERKPKISHNTIEHHLCFTTDTECSLDTNMAKIYCSAIVQVNIVTIEIIDSNFNLFYCYKGDLNRRRLRKTDNQMTRYSICSSVDSFNIHMHNNDSPNYASLANYLAYGLGNVLKSQSYCLHYITLMKIHF